MNISSIFSAISLIGAISSLLLALIFLFSNKEKKTPNYFLSLLFLLIAIRIGMLYVYEQNIFWLSNLYFNLMHAAFWALGPTLFFYIRSYQGYQIVFNSVYKHFIPSLLLLLGAFAIRQWSGERVWMAIYILSMIYPFFYIIPGALKIKSYSSKEIPATAHIWLYSLSASIGLIVLINILYFFWDFPFYLVTGLAMFLFSYLVIYLSINHQHIFIANYKMNGRKYANLNLNEQQVEKQFEKIKAIVEQQKLYLNPQIQINTLAKKSGLSIHHVSSTINIHTNTNFSNFINNYRIAEAKRLLIHFPKKKIISVAFESGFHSISSFNQIFKEKTGIAPSVFRRKHQESIPDL